MKTLYGLGGLFVFWSIVQPLALAQTSPNQVGVKLDNRIQVIAELADTPAKQTLGLSFRKGLPPNHGMLFIYNNPDVQIFWMRNMQFPIDILWIRHQRIVHIEKNIPPPKNSNQPLKTYGHGVLADMVLEVPAWFTTKHQIRVGQTAFIEP